MFKFIKKYKRLKQISEGLALLEDGIRVQLEQANWHLNLSPEDMAKMSEYEKTHWTVYKKHSEYVLSQISDIWDGKLHY